MLDSNLHDKSIGVEATSPSRTQRVTVGSPEATGLEPSVAWVCKVDRAGWGEGGAGPRRHQSCSGVLLLWSGDRWLTSCPAARSRPDQQYWSTAPLSWWRRCRVRWQWARGLAAGSSRRGGRAGDQAWLGSFSIEPWGACLPLLISSPSHRTYTLQNLTLYYNCTACGFSFKICFWLCDFLTEGNLRLGIQQGPDIINWASNTHPPYKQSPRSPVVHLVFVTWYSYAYAVLCCWKQITDFVLVNFVLLCKQDGNDFYIWRTNLKKFKNSVRGFSFNVSFNQVWCRALLRIIKPRQ